MTASIEEKTIRSLRIHYYAYFVLLGALFLLIFFRVIHVIDAPRPLSIALSQYSIVCTLAAIPVALKLFAYTIRKKKPAKSAAEGINLYKKAFFLRFYLISFVILGNIALYAFSYNNNFAWLLAILFLSFLFCKPSHQELKKLTELSANEQNA